MENVRPTNLIRGSPSIEWIVPFLSFFRLGGGENWWVTIKLLSNYRWNGRSSRETQRRNETRGRGRIGSIGVVGPRTSAAIRLRAVAVSAIAERDREREGYRWTQAPCVPRTSLRTSRVTKPVVVAVSPLADRPA